MEIYREIVIIYIYRERERERDFDCEAYGHIKNTEYFEFLNLFVYFVLTSH